MNHFRVLLIHSTSGSETFVLKISLFGEHEVHNVLFCLVLVSHFFLILLIINYLNYNVHKGDMAVDKTGNEVQRALRRRQIQKGRERSLPLIVIFIRRFSSS